MNTIIAILRAVHCKSTHHFFAVDALDEVQTARGKLLADLLLAHYGDYLKGAKDPDNVFKDFENHVLHVRDGYWGGAAKTSEKWLDRSLKLLAAGEWKEAAYAVGVLSHYFSDPFMPLHTAQSPRETIVHRPLEWSVCCTYQKIYQTACNDSSLESYALATGSDWIADAVLRGATMVNQFYDLILDDYDMREASKHPELALGTESNRCLAMIFTWVLTGWGGVIDRIANESSAAIPKVSLAIPTLLAGVQMPAKRIVTAIESSEQRKEVEKILDEYQRTGNVVRNRSSEQRVVAKVRKERPELRPNPIAVQRVVSSELMLESSKSKGTINSKGNMLSRTPVPTSELPVNNPQIPSQSARVPSAIKTTDAPKPTRVSSRLNSNHSVIPKRTRNEPPETNGNASEHALAKPSKRSLLTMDSPIVDGPAIGPKTAERFRVIGLSTIRDLMTHDAEWIAQQLNTKWITEKIVAQWQDQARLACQIERLSAAGAGLLLMAGIRTARDLVSFSSEEVLGRVHAAAQTSEGKRLLRDQGPPPPKTVQRWIDAARSVDTAVFT